MQTNALPHYDNSVNTTGCCPKFNPEGWDGQMLHFEEMPFVRATTKAALHIPLNMGSVFERVFRHLEDAKAMDPNRFIVLSRDLSPWQGEHLFSASAPVPEEDNVTLSGEFITKVFEGPYRDARRWHEDMKQLARDNGNDEADVYFFYTTCPKCAKTYGQNYVVGIARIS